MDRRATLRSAVLGFVVASVIAGMGPEPAAGAEPVSVPADGGTYFGVQLDWANESVGSFSSRLGRTPIVFGEYTHFPLTGERKAELSTKVDQIRAVGGKFLLTVMPNDGLTTVTSRTVRDLADTVGEYNRRGVDVFLVFGHEMNGSWYAWGQQPTAYVDAFRRVAKAVRRSAPRTAMVWSPNYGGGYPFSGGAYSVKPGTSDFSALDTNRDRLLTMADDMYGPYYPGDGFVDWVSLSHYHWGHVWPWGENEVPEPGQFAARLLGDYSGLGGDERAVPDFYGTYAVGRNKPMAIAETSAMYNLNRSDGATNFDIKTTWASQVVGPDLGTLFPRLKMVLWFEYAKQEGDLFVDWRVTHDPLILATFRSYLGSRLIFAP